MFQKIYVIIKNYKTVIIISIFVSALTTIVVLSIGGIVLFINDTSRLSAGNSLSYRDMVGEGNQDNDAITKRDLGFEELRIIDVVERASPAVVSIVVTKDMPIIERYFEELDPFRDDFFNYFFDRDRFRFRIPYERQRGTEKREIGGGSGFLISSEGHIVTNNHVVNDDKAEYTVLMNDGSKYDAEILAKDSMLDVAVLKVKGKDFPYLSFGDSDALKPGQTVIAIGNALAEFRNSVSVGVVSGLSRSIVAGNMFGILEQLEGVIQTDAAINPGNSGGPLLDSTGRVVGINVAMSHGAENIGFALPSNTVKTIVDSVKQHGEIIRPYLGVRYIPVTESLQKKNNLSVNYGVLVSRGATSEDLAVIPGSPADKAGIMENDIILTIDGVPLTQEKSLVSIIRQKSIGQTVKLKIMRKGAEKEVDVILEKAPKNL